MNPFTTLAKELDDLNIYLNKDQFIREEQVVADAELDKILEESEKVKRGKQSDVPLSASNSREVGE